MESSFTRESFRTAIEKLQTWDHAAHGLPAFLSSVAAVRLDRPHLPDLPAEHPKGAHRQITIAEAARQLAQNEITSVELTQHALNAIAQRNTELNAFVHAAPAEDVLHRAERMDRERRHGGVRGWLHGIPISVKDLIAVEGMPNTASSKLLEGDIAKTDARVVQLLKSAGAIILGKTHTHEFALGVTTPQSRNPWDSSRDPGGSSGGSAIAVATGMGLASLGTDTRASVRVPAALCGIVGFKPTYGLIPPDGIIALSWSMDHVGLLTSSVEDAAILLTVLDASAGASHRSDYTKYLNKDIRGLRIGAPFHALENADAEVARLFHKSVEALRDAGVNIIETSLPSSEDFDLANSVGLIISRCEAAAYHRAFGTLEENKKLYTRQVYEQLEEASRVPAVDYLQAQRLRANFQKRMLEHIENFDALLMPTSLVPAPVNEEVERYFTVLSRNCIPWSFVGFPAISVPCGFTAGRLPVGAQFVSAPMEDGRLLAIAAAFEAIG